MKAIVALVLLGSAAFLVYNYSSSSMESFDPTEQGKETRATIAECKSWTEVLDRTKAPRKWRRSTSDFDFRYTEKFDEKTRESIEGRIENNSLKDGFSFFYRFTDAITFAANFDRTGEFLNIQDKEGKGNLMDIAGG